MDIELIEKLWLRTKVVGKCWVYTGANRGKYGAITHNGKLKDVKRLSLRIYHGLKYQDKSWLACHVDELCSSKLCWNPTHLYAGTYKTNMVDAIKRDTHNLHNKYAHRNACSNGHEYTDKNSFTKADGSRGCKSCKSIWDAKSRAKKLLP